MISSLSGKSQIKSYKDLIVWKKSMLLVSKTYQSVKSLPDYECYGLTSQMRRCVISIPANIAEGWRRGGRRDHRYFLRIAYGSSAELETYIEIIRNLNFGFDLHIRQTEVLLEEVMEMLNKMTTILSKYKKSN